jgi:hypothetical protein
MPANFRPQGVLCNNYIYADGTKESPYARLKRFLFEQDSGRTDVLFFSSAASGLEPNIGEDNAATPNTYHCTGGLIDGIAKAIIQGNPSIGRPGRSLYATSVKLGYESNVCPGFDPWNSATWANPNTTGAGGFLAGSATAYGSYFYYTRGSTLQTGLLTYSIPVLSTNNDTQQTNYNPNTGEFESYSWKNFLASTFIPIDSFLTDFSSTIEKEKNYYHVALTDAPAILSSSLEYFSTSTPVFAIFSQMPEQPQRSWTKVQPFIQTENDTFYVGIGYIKNGVVETLFSSTHSSYIPAGLTVGQTEASVAATFPSSIEISREFTGTESSYNDIFSFTEGMGRIKSQNLEFFNNGRAEEGVEPIKPHIYFNSLIGRKVIVRKVTINDIITIRGLNILANAPTTKAAYDGSDGYRTSNVVIFRWMWANPQTITGPGNEQAEVNKFLQHWGLALSSVDSGVSPEQSNLPYARTFGLKTHLYSNSGYQSSQWASTVGRLVQEVPTQIKGSPIVLSTVNPSGLFALTKLDTPELTGTNPAPTIDKDRCLLVRPSLGLFHDGIIPNKGGLSPTTRALTTAEKNNLLGIFKSPSFSYVTSVYTVKSYTGNAASFPERKSNIAPVLSSQVVLTAHEKTIGSGATLTAILTPASTTALVGNENITFDINEPIPREALKQYIGLNIDLNSVNSNWTKSEFRFGFLGKGSANITAGTMIIGSHFGIDRSNAHGISFTKMESSFRFRSGDIGYNFDNGVNARSINYVEIFKTIYERQGNGQFFNIGAGTGVFSFNETGIPNAKRKLVIFYEIGIWELANPNESYNGYNTYQYIFSQKLRNGVPVPGGVLVKQSTIGIHAIAPLDAYLKNVGFTEDEYVIVFYTPSHLTRVNSNSVNSITNPESWINDINQRSTFQRASEIFSNNILNGKGLYNAKGSNQKNASNNVFTHGNSCYINFGSIPTILANLATANVQTTAEDWYVSDGESVDYTQYSPAGSLAIGSMLLDYLYSATNPTVNFAPPWIPPFSKMLNYTTDPVSGADFAFVTVSTDPVDIRPYLVELDAIIDNQANAANDQATRTLCYFKTKTLQ